MEPRTAAPSARIKTIKALSEAGIPTNIMLAPIIPAINDAEIERILESAADAGAKSAGYAFIRLPHEVRPLFHEWLEAHFPQRAEHVKNLIRQSRSGKDYQSTWGQRFTGTGVFSEMIIQRFKIKCKKLNLNKPQLKELSTCLFSTSLSPLYPQKDDAETQLELF